MADYCWIPQCHCLTTSHSRKYYKNTHQQPVTFLYQMQFTKCTSTVTKSGIYDLTSPTLALQNFF